MPPNARYSDARVGSSQSTATSQTRPGSPSGPAATLSRRASDQPEVPRSARNTSPAVVPMNSRVGEANASAQMAAALDGSEETTLSGHEAAKSFDTNTSRPAATATTLASAGREGL